mgnify:FL=1
MIEHDLLLLLKIGVTYNHNRYIIWDVLVGVWNYKLFCSEVVTINITDDITINITINIKNVITIIVANTATNIIITLKVILILLLIMIVYCEILISINHSNISHIIYYVINNNILYVSYIMCELYMLCEW